MSSTPATIDRETDARFWATGYKPGHKLDRSNPQDKAMIPVWLDIQAKVKAEDAAGTLVTTYDHPVVAQHLADASVAHQAAVANLGAAAAAPDPQVAQEHVAAAATASDVSAQKAGEAASKQPSTVSPQLAHDAAREVAQNPPPPHAPPEDHIAHAQAIKSLEAGPVRVLTHPRDIIEKEADARWWALGYRPGQKLDLSNPTDRALMPIWMDIYKKVKAEDAVGKLVLTYNHPVVDQALADAHVADQMVVAHVDAAATAPNPQAAQEHAAAAAAAAQIAAQKAREAAAHQPPTVDPRRAHDAARAVTRNPPPPHAPAREHIAHEQAKRVGTKAEEHQRHARQRRPARSTVHPHKVRDHRGRATAFAHQAGAPYVLVIERPDGTLEQQSFRTRGELDAAYAHLSEQHDQYAYLGAFDLAARPDAPVVESAGMAPAPPEHAEAPGPAPSAPSVPEAPGASVPSPDVYTDEPSAPPTGEKKKMSTGAIIAIAVGVVGGGIMFYNVVTSKKKPARRQTALVVAPSGSSVRRVGVA
jgi:hypothetical protein